MTPSSRPATRRSTPTGRSDTSAPLYAVGARTGRAAEASGWRLALPPAQDAEGLIKALSGALKPGASVLYLAGRDRKGAIETALAEPYALEIVEAYAAEAREAWRPREAAALASCVAALHYSRRSASLAAALAKAAGAQAPFLGLEHVCLSSEVAEPLQAIGATRVAIAETPDEAALFQSCAKGSAGLLPLGRPVYRARENRGRKAMIDEETKGDWSQSAGAPVNRDARPDPGVIEGEIAAA